MQNFILLFLFVAINVSIHAQYVQSQNARSFALSGAMVAVPDPGSGNNNAGALAARSKSGCELSYRNRYMLPDLGTQSIALNFVAGKGVFSPTLAYFGSAAYNQASISLAYGHQLAKWFFAGVNFVGVNQSIQVTAEQSYGVSGDIGLFAKFENGFACGTKISTPGSFITDSENYLSQNLGLNLGLAYGKPEQFLLSTQLSWEETGFFLLAGGVEFFPVRYLALRAGFKLPESTSFSFGMGLNQNRWSLNIGFEQHQTLGFSGSISLLINFGRNEI